MPCRHRRRCVGVELIEGYAQVDDLDAFLDALTDVGEEHGCVVQAFDARAIAGRAHLEHALRTARRAIERGESIARDPAVEVLCYAAGTRQIDEALSLGVGEGRTPVVVLVAGGFEDDAKPATGSGEDAAERAAATAVRELVEPAELERGATYANPDRLRSVFEIGDAEIAATDVALDGESDLETLVRERIALLAVER